MALSFKASAELISAVNNFVFNHNYLLSSTEKIFRGTSIEVTAGILFSCKNAATILLLSLNEPSYLLWVGLGP